MFNINYRVMRYLQRSVKYFIALSVIYIAMVYLSSYLESVILTPGEQFRVIMSTQRGLFLIVALCLLSAVYPSFGFVRRFTKGDIALNREQIITALQSQGMVLDHESEGRMTFISGNFFRRCTLMFEDHIKVIQQPDGQLSLSGNRRIVAYTIYRLEPMIAAAEQL